MNSLKDRRGPHPGKRETDVTLSDIRDVLYAQNKDMASIKQDIGAMREILEAWNSIKVIGRFVKWLAGIVAAGTVLAVAWKGFILKP